jgi:putative ABC transport system ATP-binding protein
MVALVGPSGSGKTTLCSIAGGILSATEGRIVVGGEDISGHSAKELTKFRQEKVGFVFQSVNLVPFLNARENLLVVDELGRRTGAPAKARADQLLEELGLADRAKNLPSQLSGGQRQRVAIGRALMNDPSLVLFDEPTSALDTKLGEQVMELIRNEMKSRGTAAIVVTHDERITHFCDRSVHIIDGRLEA